MRTPFPGRFSPMAPLVAPDDFRRKRLDIRAGIARVARHVSAGGRVHGTAGDPDDGLGALCVGNIGCGSTPSRFLRGESTPPPGPPGSGISLKMAPDEWRHFLWSVALMDHQSVKCSPPPLLGGGDGAL